jgi:hypothetical protein
VLSGLRRHLSYANVMASIAVFIALGGSSYAAVQLSKGQVKGKHIAKNAIKSGKVRDGSLLSKDFKAGQLPAGAPGAKGDTGSQGAQGPRGEQGETGATGESGPPGMSNVANVYSIGPLNSVSPKTHSVSCPTGKKVVGTGHNISAAGNDETQKHVRLAYVLINNDDTAVLVKAIEDSAGTTGNWNIVAQAQCANVGP